MTWTPELVRQRFVEAADTERRTFIGRFGPSGDAGFWPPTILTMEDKNGWGTDRLKEDRALKAVHLPPSAGAIQRYEECLAWGIDRAENRHREAIWAYAHAAAGGVSMSSWCRRHKVKRSTAYHRITVGIECIAVSLAKDEIMLRLPELPGIGQIDVAEPMKSLSSSGSACTATERGARWTGERPEDRPADSPEERDLSWAARQNARRAKLAEAERRLRGQVEAA